MSPASQANVRQGPSTGDDVILTLSEHDNLKRIDLDSTATKWYKVTLQLYYQLVARFDPLLGTTMVT